MIHGGHLSGGVDWVSGVVFVAAPVVQDRGAPAAVDGHTVALMAPRAGEPVGVQLRDQLGVAGVPIHQVSDREIHGRLRCRSNRLPPSKYHAPDG